MHSTSSTAFAGGPHLFPLILDQENDKIFLIQLDEEGYRKASFLDQRLLQNNHSQQWVSWTELELQSQMLLPAADFIFHIGHAGSTLIARLLGELEPFFVLREPQILRDIAEIDALDGKPDCPWPPTTSKQRLKSALGWFSRTPRPDQQAIIKTTSFVNAIADQMAGGRKSLYLHLSINRYLETILAGENSRREIAMLAGSRLNRLHNSLGQNRWKLWELSEAKKIALTWLCEMVAMQTAAASAPVDQSLWMSFDDFLVDPETHLSMIARHFGAEVDSTTVSSVINGPIMSRYSKAPEHEYSPGLREKLLAQTRSVHRKEISDAISWLKFEAKDEFSLERAMNLAEGEHHVQAAR